MYIARMIQMLKKRITKINSIPLPKKLLRVAAYARVSKSTDGLERSLDTQIRYFKSIISNNKSWQFVRVFFDDGISGTSIKKRAGFNEMIDAAKSGNIDIILTKSVTRFARNTVDLLETVRLLKSINVEIRFEKENISTFTSEGEVMLTILASFAQAEAENLSQNVKWGKIKKIEMGKDQVHNNYGYDYKNGQYVINKEEAKIVKYIFREFINGKTYQEIALKLKERKIKTRRNNLFNYPQVKVILKNEKYVGYTILQKHYTSDPIRHIRALNVGEMKKYKLDNTHPQIISLKDFEKAQKIMMKLSEKFCHSGKKYIYERIR